MMLNEHAYNLIMSYYNNGHTIDEIFQCLNTIFGPVETPNIYNAALNYKVLELENHLKTLGEYPNVNAMEDVSFKPYFEDTLIKSVSIYGTVYENYYDFIKHLYNTVAEHILLDEDVFDLYLDEERLSVDTKTLSKMLEDKYNIFDMYDFITTISYGNNVLNDKDLFKLFKEFLGNEKIAAETNVSVGSGVELLSYNMETTESLSFAIVLHKQNYMSPCIKVIKGISPLVIKERYGYSMEAINMIGLLKIGENYTYDGVTFIRLT